MNSPDWGARRFLSPPVQAHDLLSPSLGLSWELGHGPRCNSESHPAPAPPSSHRLAVSWSAGPPLPDSLKHIWGHGPDWGLRGVLLQLTPPCVHLLRPRVQSGALSTGATWRGVSWRAGP